MLLKISITNSLSIILYVIDNDISSTQGIICTMVLDIAYTSLNIVVKSVVCTADNSLQTNCALVDIAITIISTERNIAVIIWIADCDLNYSVSAASWATNRPIIGRNETISPALGTSLRHSDELLSVNCNPQTGNQ